jgi:MFS family permease
MLSTFISNFSPLRLRNFRIYLGGQAFSLVGTWLQVTAQSWVVWKLSGSTAGLGWVWALNTLPLLVISPWSGVWADRFDRRRILIATQIGAMLLAFVLAYLTQTEVVALWHVYLLSFVLGIITAIDFPAQQAFIGDLSGMSQVRKAISLNMMVFQMSRILGPAIGGFILGRIGAAAAFWLNGLSFLAVIASLLLVRSNQIRVARQGNPLTQFGEALGFVRSQPRIQDLLMFITLVAFFGLAILSILPSVADTVLRGGATTLGTLMAASGAGAFVGTIFLVPYLQAQRKPALVMASAITWMGVWFAVFSLAQSVPVASASLFFASMGPPTVVTMGMGLLQLLAPPDMRARLVSLFIMFSFGTQPIASLLVGYSAEVLTTPTTIMLYGVLLILGALTLLTLRPGLRRWELERAETVPILEAVAMEAEAVPARRSDELLPPGSSVPA